MPLPQYEHSIEEIKARLGMRAMELAHAFGLHGKLHGKNYWVRDRRRQDGGSLTSFSINIGRGVWKNFAGPPDEGGDLLRLVAVFACGGDNRKAVPWALDWLGLTGKKPDPIETKKLLARAKAQRDEEAREAEGRRRAAKAVWLNARPLDGADPASLYLKARGIDVTKLAGGIPRALRFTPSTIALPESEHLPAMVANISGAGGMISCHRTYLEQHGGVWRKAWTGQTRDGKKIPAKRALGEFAGGSIRLTRGASGKPLAQAPADEWPAIGEGIENVLTAALAKPELRCLSSVSGSNLGNVALPPQIRGVYLLADNDTEPQAIAMFDRAMDAYVARGIEPVSVRAEGAKDLNALIEEQTA